MASMLQRCRVLLAAPANELAFALRATVRWSRPRLQLPHEPKELLFRGNERAEAAAAQLVAAYDLGPLAACSTRATFAGSLQRLSALQEVAAGQAMPVGGDGCVRALDVGCGDFHYAMALQRWLSRHGAGALAPRPVVLRGIEVDAYALQRDGRARIDHARAHGQLAAATAGGATVTAEVADFTRRAWPEQDILTLFFPFLSAYACLQWGLPLSRLRPRTLLARAIATLRPGGWLLVANQTAREAARLERLLAGQAVERLATVSMASELVPWAERTAAQQLSLWRRVQ